MYNSFPHLVCHVPTAILMVAHFSGYENPPGERLRVIIYLRFLLERCVMLQDAYASTELKENGPHTFLIQLHLQVNPFNNKIQLKLRHTLQFVAVVGIL